MKRKNGIIIALSVLLVIVFSAGLLSFFSVGFSNWDYKTWFDRFSPEEEGIQVIEEAPSMLSYAFEVVPEMDLKLGTAGVNVSGYSTHTINATVLPSSAIDKYVIWSVEWATPDSAFASGKTVTDYLTVVPTVAGSSEALLTCLQSFRGDQIKVNATSRAGGFTSSCLVNFIGIPTSYEFVPVGEYDTVEGVYVMFPGNTYIFDIVFDNIYDDVDPSLINGYVPYPNDWAASHLPTDAPRVTKKINGLDYNSHNEFGEDLNAFKSFCLNPGSLFGTTINTGLRTFSVIVPSDIFTREFTHNLYKYTLSSDSFLQKERYFIYNPSLDPGDSTPFESSGYSYQCSGNPLKFFFATDVTGLTLDEEEIDIL